MGLLSSLASLTKAAGDPGAIVQDALNAVLPKEIAGVLGNAGAALVDYYSGNEVMAAKHGLEALRDLPQLATALSKHSSGGTAGFEPSLPKAATAQSMATSGTWRTPANLQSLLQQLRGLGIGITSDVKGTAAEAAPQSTVVASSAAHSTTQASSADSGAKAGSSDSTTAIAALDKMSDTDFMNAIKSGKLDKSIKDDPAAMRAIQARMDAISQMNQLLTSMMQAMHQMQMAIIQNIRV